MRIVLFFCPSLQPFLFSFDNLQLQPGSSINFNLGTLDIKMASAEIYDLCFWTSVPNGQIDIMVENDNNCTSMIPLSINGLDFSAKQIEENVLLTWQLFDASIYNTLKLEKSKDGQHYETLAELESSNSEWTDRQPFIGDNFYRLALEKENGQLIYSDIQVLYFEKEQAVLQQNQPNPFSGQTTIRYHLPHQTKTARLDIRNVLGQSVKSYALSQSADKWLILEENDLEQGTYFYSLYVDGDLVETLRMVIFAIN